MVVGIVLLALIGTGAYFLPRLFEQAPEQAQVPDVIGLSENRARTEIVDAGLTVGEVSFANSATVPPNRVISQDPGQTDFVDPGSTVDLVVSKGKPEVSVPELTGTLRAEASERLRSLELVPEFRETESDAAKNTTVGTEPGSGQLVEEGSTVVVLYSDGPEQVPNVIGLQQEEAEARLTAAGFQPVVREEAATTEPRGTVVDQFPEPGDSEEQGEEVVIFVSTYEEPTVDPSPTEPAEPTETTSPTASGLPTPLRPVLEEPISAREPLRRSGPAGRRTPGR